MSEEVNREPRRQSARRSIERCPRRPGPTPPGRLDLTAVVANLRRLPTITVHQSQVELRAGPHRLTRSATPTSVVSVSYTHLTLPTIYSV